MKRMLRRCDGVVRWWMWVGIMAIWVEIDRLIISSHQLISTWQRSLSPHLSPTHSLSHAVLWTAQNRPPKWSACSALQQQSTRHQLECIQIEIPPFVWLNFNRVSDYNRQLIYFTSEKRKKKTKNMKKMLRRRVYRLHNNLLTTNISFAPFFFCSCFLLHRNMWKVIAQKNPFTFFVWRLCRFANFKREWWVAANGLTHRWCRFLSEAHDCCVKLIYRLRWACVFAQSKSCVVLCLWDIVLFISNSYTSSF